jgi:GNAT superfamily N-acetyltransferase
MIEVRRIPADTPDALWLVEAMIDSIVAIYGGDLNSGPSATPEDFSPPGGGFVAIYDGERPVAGGGVKRVDADTGEIKRMYVVPDLRGQGLARTLLGALEDLARDLGYSRVRLDTGNKQPHALALYLSAGYSEISDYNGNPKASFWGEKLLTP